jgi:hypothetical protein
MEQQNYAQILQTLNGTEEIMEGLIIVIKI